MTCALPEKLGALEAYVCSHVPLTKGGAQEVFHRGRGPQPDWGSWPVSGVARLVSGAEPRAQGRGAGGDVFRTLSLNVPSSHRPGSLLLIRGDAAAFWLLPQRAPSGERAFTQMA